MAKTTAAKTNTEAAGPTLEDHIDRRLAILAQIEAKERELERAVNQLAPIRRDLDEALNACGGYKSAMERLKDSAPVPGTADARDQALGRAAGESFRRAEARLTEQEASIRLLRAHIDVLRNEELPACDADTSFDELAAHCSKVKAEADRVRRLEAKVTEHRQAVSDLEAARPSLRDLDHQREDLLARIATGGATQADLDRFDEDAGPKRTEILKAIESTDARKEQLQQGINGLLRLIDEAVGCRDRLGARTPAAVEQFLLTESRRVHLAYLRTVESIRLQHAELIALNTALSSLPAGRAFVTTNTVPMVLPAFELPGVEQPADPMDRGTLLRSSGPGHAPACLAAVHALRARLLDAGFVLRV